MPSEYDAFRTISLKSKILETRFGGSTECKRFLAEYTLLVTLQKIYPIESELTPLLLTIRKLIYAVAQPDLPERDGAALVSSPPLRLSFYQSNNYRHPEPCWLLALLGPCSTERRAFMGLGRTPLLLYTSRIEQ